MDTFGSSKLKGTLSGDLWTGLGSGRMIQTLIIKVDELKKNMFYIGKTLYLLA